MATESNVRQRKTATLSENRQEYSIDVDLDQSGEERKDSQPPDLLQEIVEHFQRIGFQIVFLFIFYILGRLGLFWTTVLGVTACFVVLKYKNNLLLLKVRKFLKHIQPRKFVLHESKLTHQRSRDLPRWVRFPDEESLHWFNNIIHALWPLICTYSEKLVREKSDPIFKEKVPPFFQPIDFKKLDFGCIPPIIGSLQVYNEDFTKRDEIILDMELYYAGNPEVDVSSRNIVVAKIKDVQFFGHCRLILSPLTKKLPLVDAIKFYFIRPPQILWNTGGLLSVLEFPKLKDMIMEQVTDQCAKMAVFPNCISKQIRDKSEDKFSLQTPMAEGVVRIALRGARNLVNKDTIGKSDPYCVVVVGSRTFKTKTVDDDLNPVWNEFYQLPVYNTCGLNADFYLYDEDVKNDENLGSISISLEQVKRERFMDIWAPLSDIKKGEIHVQMQYCDLAPYIQLSQVDNPPGTTAKTKKQHSEKNEKYDLNQLTHLSEKSISMFGRHITADDFSRCYINVYVDSAANLPRNHPTDLRAYPSPFVKVIIPGECEKQSCIVKDMCNPVWEQGFDFLVNNSPDKFIKFEVIDSEKNTAYVAQAQALVEHAAQVVLGGDKRSSGKVIGSVKVFLNDILTSTNMGMEMSFPLEGTVESQLLLKLTARFIVAQIDTSNGQIRIDNKGNAGNDADVTSPLSSGSQNGEDFMRGVDMDMTDENTSGFMRTSTPDRLSHLQINQNLHDSLTRRSSNSFVADHPSPSSHSSGPKLCLRISFQKERNKLYIEVDRAEGLVFDRLNPYVSLKLMPDNIKKKTDTAKVPTEQEGGSRFSLPSPSDACGVDWKKTFEFACPLTELSNKTVKIKVKNNNGFVKSDTTLGYVLIPLYTLPLEKPIHSWFLITDIPDPTPMLSH